MAIVCFTFDDGRGDSYNAFKLLKKHNLKGTFFITSGYIDGTFESKTFCGGRAPLTNAQILEIHKNGMEIASHGDKHITSVGDFNSSVLKLERIIGKQDKIGFSVPRSNYSADELSAFYLETKNKIAYIRVGRHPKCRSFLNKVLYFIYHKIIRNQLCFNFFNKRNVNFNVDKQRIYSIVVKNDTKLKHLCRFIEKYAKKDVLIVLMFHSIVENPTDPWEWGKVDFDRLCGFVSMKKASELLKNDNLINVL